VEGEGWLRRLRILLWLTSPALAVALETRICER
jgi:hypothetical protein